MKLIPILVVSAVAAIAAELIADDHTIRVIDGDTVRMGAHGESVRLIGLNAPETGTRALCPAERTLGLAAKHRLESLVAAGPNELTLVRCSCPEGTEGTHACNFGRSCGVLKSGGTDVATLLIGEGLAVPFTCEATRCPKLPRPWCGGESE